jgi:hypothetical protein
VARSRHQVRERFPKIGSLMGEAEADVLAHVAIVRLVGALLLE